VKVVLPGGSGQVGTILARALKGEGHEVVVVSRHPRPAPWRTVGWDARTPGPWMQELDGAHAVVNLAGRSVECRYTAANRAEIMESRVGSTRLIGRAIAESAHPPRVWLQAGTATIYAHRFDAPNDEATGILGGDEPGAPDAWRFSIEVAKSWETAVEEAVVPRTRKVIMRSAMTMSPDRHGVFDVLLGLVRRGLGGTSGDGRQYVSWVHEQDFVAAVKWIVSHDDLAGPVNIAAPAPLPNAEFMRTLRAAWGARIGIPAPAWLLEPAAFVLRTESELLLKSRRVISGKLAAQGFRFRFAEWRAAAEDLCAQWRRQRAARSSSTARSS